jgi:hypothetical protein
MGPKSVEYRTKSNSWNEPMFRRFSIVFLLVIIWHRGSTLSGERGSYGRILVHGGWDMIPCILGPDIGVLGKESGLASNDER